MQRASLCPERHRDIVHQIVLFDFLFVDVADFAGARAAGFVIVHFFLFVPSLGAPLHEAGVYGIYGSSILFVGKLFDRGHRPKG